MYEFYEFMLQIFVIQVWPNYNFICIMLDKIQIHWHNIKYAEVETEVETVLQRVISPKADQRSPSLEAKVMKLIIQKSHLSNFGMFLHLHLGYSS